MMEIRRLQRARSDTFHRWRRRLTGRISAEECEIAINEALRVLKLKQIANREQAVRVITQVNGYRAQYHEAVSAGGRIERQIAKSRCRQVDRRFDELNYEFQVNLRMAEETRPKLEELDRVAEAIKRDIRAEEDCFRRAIARALAAKVLIEAEVCSEALADLNRRITRDYPEIKAMPLEHPPA